MDVCVHVAVDGDCTPDFDLILTLERARDLELAKYLDLVTVGTLSVPSVIRQRERRRRTHVQRALPLTARPPNAFTLLLYCSLVCFFSQVV
jgi:hypothetical protein